MFSFDLLYPWITLALTLVPLLYVQRWIHRHLFGVSYLISREKQAATLFYYGLLLPGVILHELSHYLMAGVFNVRSIRFAIYPEVQEDGSLEMGFVQLEYVFNPVYAAFIGIAPLLAGMLAVILISNSVLDLPSFFARVRTGDIYEIGAAIQTLVTKPDFPLWAYLLFGIANAMMPNREDRRGWWIVLVVAVLFLGFMTIIGLGNIVAAWLAGPIAQALYSLSAVFGTVLFVDGVAALLIASIEWVLERLTGQRVEYQPATAALAAGPTRAKIKSVYELNLPLPPLPGKVTVSPAPRLPAATSAERPAIGSGAARPALPAANQPGSRPALGSGRSEAEAEKPALSPGVRAPSPAAPTFGSRSSPAPAKSDEPAPAKPATPFGSRPGAPSPFGKPSAQSPAAQSPAAPGGIANRPFGSPPVGSTPSKPASPISGPPALARPGGPPSRPNLPAPANRPASPAPKPTFGAPPRPARPGSEDDDYIDADVIEEEDDNEPTFTKDAGKPSGGVQKPRSPFGSRPSKPDEDDEDEDEDDEPKYVGLDEV
jgi:hypothetical protein